jgi:1-acyl-sn-glycerol-3-phosphate acyltransferase
MARGVVTLLLFGLWTLLLLPVQVLALRLRWRATAEAVPMLYHRGVARLLRVKVKHSGDIASARPTLYVVNHISWLDIVVLDTLLKGSFVAKHEVATWPLFGLLARLQRCVFVERKAPRTRDGRDMMSERLAAGDPLILFPEGTSSDGMRILPFKTSFFAVAEKPVNGRPLLVQPVSLAYSRLNGLPAGRRWMSVFAWVGDEDLLPHLWRFVQNGPSEVEVTFHPPVTIAQFGSRKAMAAHCHRVIAHGVSATLSGRHTPAPLPPPGPAPQGVAPPAPLAANP